MKALIVVIVVALAIGAADLYGVDVPPTVLDGIGDIVAIGELFQPLCNCGQGVELLDDAGRRLAVAIGPGWDGMRSGFRIGAISPGDSTALVVPQGGEVERKLLALMWGYLDRNYSYWEQQRLADPEYRGEWKRPEDARAIYLLNVLSVFQQQEDLRRWLDHNVTPEDQERIFSTGYMALDTDRERQIFEYICLMRGGSPWIKKRLSNREVGGFHSELVEGACH